MQYTRIDFGYGNLHCQKCGHKNINKKEMVSPCDHLQYLTIPGVIDEPLYDPNNLNLDFKNAEENTKEIIFEEEFFKKNLDYHYSGITFSEGNQALLELFAIYKYNIDD
jgi:hypothetical protein